MCKPEKKYSLINDIIRPHWEEYTQRKGILHERIHTAVRKMLKCRTPENGANIYACPKCGEVVTVYHSCKHRFCPQCGQLDINKWANKIVHSMLDTKHHHIVFTVPHKLNNLFRYNEKLLYALLMRICCKVLTDWFREKHNLQPGIMCVLHTFGSNLQYHVHTHLVVSAGGLTLDFNELVEFEGNYLVNKKWLAGQFRHEFEGELIKLHEKGGLNYPPELGPQYFLSYIKNLNDQKWIAFIGKLPLKNVEDIVGYIGRYTRRACISEYKIEKVSADEIKLRYKDYKALTSGDKETTKRVTYNWEMFLDLLFQHIPHKHSRTVTYSGCYNSRNIKRIPEGFKYHGQTAEANKVETYKDYLLQSGKENELKCSFCGVEYLLISREFKPNRMQNLILKGEGLSDKLHPLLKEGIDSTIGFKELEEVDLQWMVSFVGKTSPEPIIEGRGYKIAV